jgi:GcrA cell cycle regulator
LTVTIYVINIINSDEPQGSFFPTLLCRLSAGALEAAMRRGYLWTHDRIALLRMLWSQGQTAEAIGARLGGLSRSAVLGKIHRLRLHADQVPANVPTKNVPTKISSNKNASIDAPARRRRRTKYRKRASADTAPAPARQYKTLLELTNITCRWPHGRPGTNRFFFCGAPEADLEHGIPYCALHMRRAYPNGPAPTSAPRAVARKALSSWS